MSGPVLLVSHDAGAASALAPVAARLARGRPLVRVLHPLSLPALGPADRVADRFAPAEAARIVAEVRPSLLLTGSSWGPRTIDKAFTAAARRAGVPSLGVLDSWDHYRGRFTAETDGAGPLVHLPDLLAVMDEPARDEMLRLGFPPDRLAVAGLARLAALPDPEGAPAHRARLAERHGLDPRALWVFFASQALSALFGGHGEARARFGFSERDALAGLAAALQALSLRLGRPVAGLVRFHPREVEPQAPEGIAVDDGPSAHAPVLAADLVAGINGAVLVDAFALGRPVVSFQPGASDPGDFVLARRGLLRPVTDPAALAGAMAEALEGAPRRDPLFGRAAGIEAVEAIARLADAMERRHAAA